MAEARTKIRRGSGVWAALLAAVLGATILVLLVPVSGGAASTLPSGFREEVVFSGLTTPTNVEFSDDGRVFVVEKSGLIKVFDGLSDTTPTTFADLRTKVLQLWRPRHARDRARPQLPDQALRVRPLRPRRGDRRHGAALGRCLPRPARQEHQTVV